MTIKKQDLIDHPNFKGSQQNVATFFDIERQSVKGWGENIPELRRLQLKERRPDIYDSLMNRW